MQQFSVDDELAALIERLAKPKPFENISFNDALWRVVRQYTFPCAEGLPTKEIGPLDQLLADIREKHGLGPKKTPTPSVADWVASIPELQRRKELTTWKAVCDLLNIDTAGDSARRKLKNWVKQNRPKWSPVPDID